VGVESQQQVDYVAALVRAHYATKHEGMTYAELSRALVFQSPPPQHAGVKRALAEGRIRREGRRFFPGEQR
jgi:hypothetical protein